MKRGLYFASATHLGIVGVGIGHVGSSWVADQFTKPAQSFGFPCLRIPDVLFSVRNQFTMQQVAQMSRGSTICKHLIAPNWRT